MLLQQSLFTEEEFGGIPLEDVFEAYFECRKKKRNTCNALAFESETLFLDTLQRQIKGNTA